MNEFPPRLIRASAGSGKTFQLTARLIALLARGELPERILATTFTRKAAGEIEDRVFRRLAEAVLEPEGAAKLSRDIGVAISSDDAAAILARVVGAQHRLNIRTMDSLFGQIARAFSLELGLLPGWEMASEAEYDRIAAQSITELLEAGSADELSLLMRVLGGERSQRSVHERLKRTARTIHHLVQSTAPAAWEWLEPPAPLTAGELSAAIERLRAMPLERKQGGTEVLVHWAKAHQRALAAAEAGRWSDFIEVGIVEKVLLGELEYARRQLGPPHLQAIEPLLAHAAATLLTPLAVRTKMTRTVVEQFGRIFNRNLTGGRLISFDDVKLFLARAACCRDLESVYYRLDSRLGHLLLDEFQDTSVDEWLVLEPVAEEILAGDEHSFFCVGDIKQAIYGWRGGRAEIFDHLASWRRGQLTPESLNESYRSAPAIMETVNTVFEKLAHIPSLEPAEWLGHWGDFPRHTTARSELPGRAELITVAVARGEEEAGVLRRTATLIKEIHERDPALSIGVLVRKNATATAILYELEALGLRGSGEGGTPLVDSRPVAVILALLTLIEHPGDTTAAFLVANSPLGASLQFTDHRTGDRARALGRELRREIHHRGLGEVLADLTRRIASHCTERDRRRLADLVSRGYAESARPCGRLDEFIAEVRNTTAEDESAAAIRVMTIHRSKGLEFDVVVFPDWGSPLQGSDRESFLCGSSTPLGVPDRVFCPVPKQFAELHPALAELRAAQRGERLRESLSVLYVALTRARCGLFMVVPERAALANQASFAHILTEALTPGFSTGSPHWVEELHTLRQGKTRPPAPSPRSPVPTAVALASSPRGRRRGLLRQTPSSLEGGDEILIARRLQLKGEAAAARGTLVHLFFREVEWLDGAPLTDARLREVSARIPLPDGIDIGGVIEEFRLITAKPEIQAHLAPSSAPGEHLEVLREHPFAFRDGEAVMTGTFDRLVLTRRDGQIRRAEIIDYKTDYLQSDEPERLAEKREFYRPQMEAYRRAAAKFTGLSPGEIRVTLLFVTPGLATSL